MHKKTSPIHQNKFQQTNKQTHKNFKQLIDLVFDMVLVRLKNQKI